MTNNRRIRLTGLTLITLAALTALLMVLCFERGVLVLRAYLAPAMFAFSGSMYAFETLLFTSSFSAVALKRALLYAFLICFGVMPFASL